MAKRVYILADEMRAAKSGHFVQGTDIEYDIPNEYPIPHKNTVIEDDGPITLRVLPNCGYLEMQKQIDNKFPENYTPDDTAVNKLKFVFGRLELDEVRDRQYVSYMDRVGWNEKNEKTRAGNTKVIFKEYNEEKIISDDITREEKVIKAKNAILALNEKEVRDLYLLSLEASGADQASFQKMKKHLYSIADANPDFILNGIKSARDKAVVALTKAIEFKQVNLNLPGIVGIFNTADKEFEPLIEISDAGGDEAKFNRTVDYLLTDEGSAALVILTDRVKEIESASLN